MNDSLAITRYLLTCIIFISLTYCSSTNISGDAEVDAEITSEDTNNDEYPSCGNGIIETGEECDDGPDNSDTVPDACREDCTEPTCGDSVIDSDEHCDGVEFGGETCVTQGFDDGDLLCSESCLIDLSNCVSSPSCVRYVNISSDGTTHDGLSWETAYTHVQQGIDDAYSATSTSENCDVWVAYGTYYVFFEDKYDTIQLRPRVFVYGGFSGSEVWREERDWGFNVTILNGYNAEDGDQQVLHVVTGSDNSTLDGFTVTAGFARGLHPDGVAGGVLNIDASPNIRNCIIKDNIAWGDGYPYGMGSFGGGIYNLDSNPVIDRCYFYRNSAGAGGSIYNRRSSPLVSNTVFHTNWSPAGVGILNNEESSPTITNCTFYRTDAFDIGAIIHSIRNSHPVLINSILWNNELSTILLVENDSDSTTQTRFCDIDGGYPGEGNIDIDPLFLDREASNFHLLLGSPCIDMDDGDSATSYDIEGLLRFDDLETPNTGIGLPPFADIGAFEFIR